MNTLRGPLAALSVAAVLAAVVCVLLPSAASAGGTSVLLAGPSFDQPTAPNFALVPTPNIATNSACLTVGADTAQTPIPGCGGTVDAAGSGALRLTATAQNQVGAVASTRSFPLSEGLDAIFDSYQFGGSTAGFGFPADGIGFFLAASDPNRSFTATQTGAAGGSLGYSPKVPSTDGLVNGYLGIGLDSWGNYATDAANGTGCTSPSITRDIYAPDTDVSVRGPGNGQVGYCLLSTTDTIVGGQPQRPAPFALSGTTRATSLVTVEVALNPAATTVTTNSGLSIAANSYAVAFTPIGSAQRVLTGTLPQVDPAQVPAGWFDPVSRLPYQLSFGWLGSTGGKVDTHEVVLQSVSTISGAIPVLTATAMAGNAGVFTAGTSGSYTITPTVAASGDQAGNPIVVTTTFPSAFTPHLPASGLPWVCTIAGQIEICSYDPPISIAPGTTLPSLVIPIDASGTPASQSISSDVATIDAQLITVSTPTTIYLFTGAAGVVVQQNAEATFPVSHLVTSSGAGLDPNAVPTVSGTGTGSPAHGTVTTSAGSVSYTPDAGYSGADSFVATVCDLSSPIACAPVTVSLTVADNVVTAHPDSVRLAPGGSATIRVIDNDTSLSGQPLNPAISLITLPLPSEGTAIVGIGGTVTFTAAPGFVGSSSFRYQVCDTSVGRGPFCSQAFATFTVSAWALAATGTSASTLIVISSLALVLLGLAAITVSRRKRARPE